ncbi:PREDICTED: 4-coumarate--CoA ligase 1-like [Eufriesea mexicana]|uniref:4-coumarate--CoA ligase 1-like n=1 Tax=Eufriesea mexicana TaxID=516756 RepID=UPI00083BF6CB|nr:PREDICTED: 4-coumarate--CoA ligase 1-like [Eufriesea mexicana]XP_017759169.1 PREDICTED: 4-coumarate--CoA ligase 1-like [Eufriesea mexicana]
MKIQDNIIYGDPVEEVPNVSLGQHLFDKLRTNADHLAQIDIESDKHYTCREILEKSVILSTVLKNYGINIEDRISTASENHPNYILSICSTLFVGATFAPLNPAYTEREFRHMLEIYQPRVIFVSQRTEKIIAKVVSTVNWSTKLIQLEDQSLNRNIMTLKEILEKNRNIPDPYTFTPVQIDDISKRAAAILCSSGTTGFPKGVMLSHRSLLIFIHTTKGPKLMDMRQGDRTLIFLPLFHGYAFGLINQTISSGGIACIMRNFNLEMLLKSVERFRISHIPLVPPILVMLAKHPMVEKYDFSSVREITSGAAPLPQNVANEVKRRTKVGSIRNGYGMTELTIVSNISDKTCLDDTIGPIMPGFKCKVVDTKTGKTLGAGQSGEICFMGDQVMLGYYKNPKTTAETIDRENWLHTGDLGYFKEDGCLYITGRIKELIKYKGFQVSPSEIEAIILTHPGVKDVAVLGKPDELSGEVPMALVVRQPGKNVSVKEIVDFANENLSPQKWLRGGVIFMESLPKTPSGKILRKQLLSMIPKL